MQNCSALEDYLQAHLANNSAGPSSVWKSHEKYTAYKIRTDKAEDGLVVGKIRTGKDGC